jgi:hypothetical protein
MAFCLVVCHTLHTQVVARVPSYVDLKKKFVRYPSVMNFEGQSGSGSQEICDLFAGFIVRTYADEPWVPSDPGPGDVSDEPPFGSLQFSLLEVLNALLDLDTNKGPGPDNVPPLILKSCASAFALPLCLLFNRSLASCVFPDRWKLSFVTLLYKSGKRNDLSNYRGIAILSTVGMLFELLVYKHMYEDLMDQLADCQHGFVKGRSTVSNTLLLF